MKTAISLLGSLLLSAQCGPGDAGIGDGAGARVGSSAGARTGAGAGGQSDIRSNCSLQHVMSRLVLTQGSYSLLDIWGFMQLLFYIITEYSGHIGHRTSWGTRQNTV